MKRIIAFLTFCALALTGCGLTQTPELQTKAFFAMDTAMVLSAYGKESLLQQAEQQIIALEQKLSVTDPDSEISALNRNRSGTVSTETAELLSSALELCRRTEGALDISIYPVVREWGFTTGEYQVPDRLVLEEALRRVDYTKVILKEDNSVVLAPSMQIDLGSVAKGYTGDTVLSFLEESGVSSAILNLGGNVQTLGTKPDGSLWRVGIAAPSGEGYAGAVDVAGKAVITSGGDQRYFEKEGKTYCHIIDPSTGCPVENGLLSVTVIGESGLVCDALSTGLFIMGLERGADLWRGSDDFEAIFITEKGITITAGLEECFSPDGAYRDAEMTVLH